MLDQFKSNYPTKASFVSHVGDLDSFVNVLEDVYTLVLDTMALIEDKKDDPEVKKVVSDVEQLLADL